MMMTDDQIFELSAINKTKFNKLSYSENQRLDLLKDGATDEKFGHQS